MRLVTDLAALEQAYMRCQSEARSAFGSGEVYVESYVPNARHIEIQVAGDGSSVVHFGERDCSVQRRYQKLIEIVPSPRLSSGMREQLTTAAMKMARAADYRGLCTFEFMVSDDDSPSSSPLQAHT